jgi:Eco57I restriction-modification methylase
LEGFLAVRSEGGLLPPDLLQRIVRADKGVEGLEPERDYHLGSGERINEAVSRSWQRLLGVWHNFRAAATLLEATEAGTSLTRERWLLILFNELGYGRVAVSKVLSIDGRDYPISHMWQRVPIHLVGCQVEIDKRTPGIAGAARTTPHGLLQDFLNRSPNHLWGFVSNGLRLRLLRDNARLTRQAYVEFDVETILENELYADFGLLWLVCHQSRLEQEGSEDCWLERWRESAELQGARALDTLRDGVEAALLALGRGFLAHSANAPLRAALRSGTLSTQNYYRELLRLVYRLLFLFVSEERDVLHPREATVTSRRRYLSHYSTRRLRELARRMRGSSHTDLFRTFTVVVAGLSADEGCPVLGLPALGGLLWSDQAAPHVDASQLANRDWLGAVLALAYTRQDGVLRSVDWRHLGSTELGSVYESLLELHPEVNADAATFSLSTGAGNERRTSGSYYTPDSLVQCLLDSALDPVLAAAASESDPESAFLALKVCDPACGSGHFLIAAAHRIAQRLAKARTGDDEPAPESTRTALRDVIGRCLYGVDLNPMAAELCKVNLWLEGLEPGRPLTFLDHHIRVGNSLLATTPELIAEGIPDGAFEPIEGDESKTCLALRKRNRLEREGQQDMLHLMVAEPRVEYLGFADQARAIDTIDDTSLAGILEKESGFQQLIESDKYRHSHLVANAWCAVFVWRKSADVSIPRCITTDALRRLEADAAGLSETEVNEVRSLTAAYGFFQWHLAFPEVFARGGFDVVIGNPPWERVKLHEEEFFDVREPRIAKAKNAATRKRLIAELPETNPALAAEWFAAVRVAAAESTFFRLSGRYPLGGVGDVNTYAVFADLFRQLVNANGMAALLLPNGLVTGFTYRAFLRHLLESRTLASFYGFENEDKIFPEVHNETKFGILTVTGARHRVDRPWFTAHIRQPHQIHDPLRRYSLTAEQIEAINPNTLNLPAFRWAADAEVLATIHEAAPVLLRRHAEGRIENPWGVSFWSMFHMTNDSELFIDHESVAPRIIERREALAILDDSREVYPLYEGKMLWHFDHRYGTYAGQTQKQANKGILPHVDDTAHDDPEHRIQPRYWVDADKVRSVSVDRSDREWQFGWRDVGPTERTFVGSIFPAAAAGNTTQLLGTTQEPVSTSALIGLLSTLVVDYAARQKSSRMSLFVVEQLPVLAPGTLEEDYTWLGASARDWLADRVFELSYTNVELARLASDLRRNLRPFRWLPERRSLLQAEIDAVALHLYGLTRSQSEWLLDSFTVLRKYEEQDRGEFRTKRLVLEIYDVLAEARRTGRPYQTRLDPPPADPSCCHPPPEAIRA